MTETRDREAAYRQLRSDAERIWTAALTAVQPDRAVRRALEKASLTGRLHLVAIGKAAWPMANAAQKVLGDAILDGVVITKYDHSRGAIGNLRIFEAGILFRTKIPIAPHARRWSWSHRLEQRIRFSFSSPAAVRHRNIRSGNAAE